MTFTLSLRFLYIFDQSGLLCAVPHQQQLKSALSSTSRVESVIELPAGLHGDIPALKAQPASRNASWLTGWAGWLYLQFYYYLAVLCDKFRLQSLRNH